MTHANHAIDAAREQVNQRCAERANAERQGNATALAAILADEFLGIGPRGFTLTKAQWLDRFQSGDLRYDTFTWDEAQTRVFGGDGDASAMAIVVGRETSHGTHQGREIQGQYRVTQVYVWQERQWRLVNLQLSMYPPAV